MSRPRARDGRPLDAGRVRLADTDRHRPLPVLPVFVGNEKRNRRAGRHAAPHAADGFRAIRLDRHPPSAAVAPLPAAEVARDRVDVDGQSGGKPFENHDQRPPVRFASREKPQH